MLQVTYNGRLGGGHNASVALKRPTLTTILWRVIPYGIH